LRCSCDLAEGHDSGVVGGPGQAKVGDLHSLNAVLKQDIGRLNVAMSQTQGVGGSQSGGDLVADPQDLNEVKMPRLLNLLFRRPSISSMTRWHWPLLDGQIVMMWSS
jgi:hypothetical protein